MDNEFEYIMDDYVVYGSGDCPWCTKAEDLLAERNLSHMVFDVKGCSAVKDELFGLARLMGIVVQKIPQIFHVKGNVIEHVGGFDQLEKRLNQ